MKTVDEAALEKYLRKCELQYRADNSTYGGCLAWLAPHCDTLEDIAAYLRELGFKIKEIMNEEDSFGESFRWVKTTSGVIVYQNEGTLKGCFAKAAKI